MTKIIRENVPRNYFVTISARMVFTFVRCHSGCTASERKRWKLDKKTIVSSWRHLALAFEQCPRINISLFFLCISAFPSAGGKWCEQSLEQYCQQCLLGHLHDWAWSTLQALSCPARYWDKNNNWEGPWQTTLRVREHRVEAAKRNLNTIQEKETKTEKYTQKLRKILNGGSQMGP